MQNNEKPLVLSLVLLVISVVVALLLSFTNSITIDKIAGNNRIEQNLAKQAVFPDATDFSNLYYEKDAVSSVFAAVDKDKNTLGWCVNVKPKGYGGEIDLIVGIKKDGTLSGIKVVSNSETAGLGAKCTDEKFTKQFEGKCLPLSVVKTGAKADNEVSAITGATITTKAISSGVNEAYEAIKSFGGGKNE